MLDEKIIKDNTLTVSRTGGLVSIEQLSNTTSNETVAIGVTTSVIETIPVIYLPHYEEIDKKPEKDRRNTLSEFKSIVKDKLRKPIDLKKLYDEQFEDDLR